MKRPIAELLLMTLNPGAQVERTHLEQETWQILRRKQGYVTHRNYQLASDPLQRLLYSEWDSVKAVDGARQNLQGTPLMRRARATLASPAQRLVLELMGPITSTKGLTLPDGAVAASAIAHLNDAADGWRERERQLWKALVDSPGYIAHVLFRGVANGRMVGSFSHWADASAFKEALARVDTPIVRAISEAVASPLTYTLYTPLPD